MAASSGLLLTFAIFKVDRPLVYVNPNNKLLLFALFWPVTIGFEHNTWLILIMITPPPQHLC